MGKWRNLSQVFFAQIEDFWPTRPCKRQNFNKWIKFESRWKFCSNLKSLNTPVLQNIKIGKMKKLESHWKFCSNWRFLTNPALHKAKLDRSIKFELQLRFWTTPVLQNLLYGKIKKFDSHWKILLKFEDFWPPQSFQT